MASVFVGDLHPQVTEPMLVERFSPAGWIHSVQLWKISFSSRYAQINFYQRADAEQALDMFNFELLLQRDSSVRKTGIGNIIRNLDKSIDDMALYDTFSIFGRVLSCKVVCYETGSKAYGYVQFECVEAAVLAIKTLNGKLLNDHKVHKDCVVSIEHFKARGGCEAHSAHQNRSSVASKHLKAVIYQPVPTPCNKVDDTPNQKVEPRPDLLSTPQIVQPQSVQKMPDMVQPALLNQQSNSTVALSTSQVPSLMEESAHKTTATSVVATETVGDTAACEEVDEMDAILKAREAGLKPETVKMLFNTSKKKKNKRKKK